MAANARVTIFVQLIYFKYPHSTNSVISHKVYCGNEAVDLIKQNTGWSWVPY